MFFIEMKIVFDVEKKRHFWQVISMEHEAVNSSVL